MKSYFEEFLGNMNENIEVFDTASSHDFIEDVFKKVNFDNNGVDWTKYLNNKEILTPSEILNIESDQLCYLMWDEYTLPVVKVRLKDVLNNIDDATAVAFGTWVIGEKYDWVYELHHEGRMRFTYL